MITVPSPVLQELHLMGSSGAGVYLISIPTYSIYLARAHDDIEWNGQTWQKFPFDIGVVNLNSEGKMPEMVVSVYDQDGVVEGWVDEYDGFMGEEANIYVVNSEHLDQDEIWSLTFNIKKPLCDLGSNIIEIYLGIDNPILRLFPSWIIHGDYCEYNSQFKSDARCAYTGSETTCDGTLKTCISYSWVERFGGCPGTEGTINDDI